MREALVGVAGSPRLAFLCHVVLGSLALDRGDVDEAAKLAEAAAAMSVAPELRPAGVALSARVLMARGRAADAAALAVDAAHAEASCEDLDLTWGTAGVTLAEALADRDAATARAALEPVAARLVKVASTIVSSEHRERFWQRPLPNARVRELAERLALPVR